MFVYSGKWDEYIENALLFAKLLNEKHNDCVYILCAYDELTEEIKEINKRVKANVEYEKGIKPSREGSQIIDFNHSVLVYLKHHKEDSSMYMGRIE